MMLKLKPDNEFIGMSLEEAIKEFIRRGWEIHYVPTVEDRKDYLMNKASVYQERYECRLVNNKVERCGYVTYR